MRQAVSYIPSLASKLYDSHVQASVACKVLTDDLSLGIIPFTNQERFLHLNVTADDPQPVERAILEGFNSHHRGYRVANVLGEFIRGIAQEVVTYGEALRELVLTDQQRPPDPRRTLTPLSFRVEPIMPMSLVTIMGQPYQIIPAADADGHRRRVRLDRTRIFRITPPGFSRFSWNDMMAELVGLDQAILSGAKPHSDAWQFSAQLELVRKAQLIVSNGIPWVQRSGDLLRDMSEVYYVHRWLRMQRFVSVLRGEIVGMINRVLKRAGLAKGFVATLELVGMPTSAEIDQALTDLMAGAVGPGVIERFVLREH